jgi:hypothetical protein
MRMTKKRALRVVLEAALKYCEGSGVGLRSVYSDDRKRELIAAATKLWGDAYDWPLTEGHLSNFGLSGYAVERLTPDT